MKIMVKQIASISLVFLSSGCGEAEQWVQRAESNQGAVCLYGSLDSSTEGGPLIEGEVQQYTAGEPLSIKFQYCTGDSSCHRSVEAECSVSVVADWVEISTHATYEYLENAAVCTSAGYCVVGSCSSDEMEQGNYFIKFGDAAAEIGIPSSTPAICLEN